MSSAGRVRGLGGFSSGVVIQRRGSGLARQGILQAPGAREERRWPGRGLPCAVATAWRGVRRALLCSSLARPAGWRLCSALLSPLHRLLSLPRASSYQGPPWLLLCLLLASAPLLSQLAFFSIFSLGYIEYIVLEKLTMFR